MSNAVASAGTSPGSWTNRKLAELVHEADLDDERFDAPEARGLDVALRGLSMVCDDQQVLSLTGPLFDGLYEYFRRGMLLGREPV